MGENELRIIICKLNLNKIMWNPQVINVEVLLQVGFGSRDPRFNTPSHKNVVDLNYKNNKTALYLLFQHGGICNIRGEAKCGKDSVKLRKLSARPLLGPINRTL